MRAVFLSFLTILTLFGNEFEKGKEIFQKKCSSCHSGYIAPDKIKENFFKRDNKLLKLKAPTENMLAYAIIEGPKKIGEPNDSDFRQEEIAEFLKDYLTSPNRENSICDRVVMRFYETKEPIKGLNENEFMALAKFFMEYKKHRAKNSNTSIKLLTKKYNEKEILKEAKKTKKQIVIEATSKYCHYCRTFKREVLSSKEVKNIINDNFIFVEVDVDRFELPFKLQKVYQKITPSFFILNSDGKLLKHYPGSWRKGDFIRILSSAKSGE